MIKEIRIGMDALLHNDFTVMKTLKEKGFPCNDSVLDPRPKDGLKYFEFHDHKTDEIVVQYEETE